MGDFGIAKAGCELFVGLPMACSVDPLSRSWNAQRRVHRRRLARVDPSVLALTCMLTVLLLHQKWQWRILPACLC